MLTGSTHLTSLIVKQHNVRKWDQLHSKLEIPPNDQWLLNAMQVHLIDKNSKFEKNKRVTPPVVSLALTNHADKCKAKSAFDGAETIKWKEKALDGVIPTGEVNENIGRAMANKGASMGISQS